MTPKKKVAPMRNIAVTVDSKLNILQFLSIKQAAGDSDQRVDPAALGAVPHHQADTDLWTVTSFSSEQST